MIECMVSRNEAIAWNMIEGKAVLLDRDEGRAIILNEVASYIWLALDKKITTEKIIALVNENFALAKEPIEKDVRSFLDDLVRRDLIRIEKE